MLQVLVGEVLRLGVGPIELMHPDEAMLREPGGDVIAPRLARLILVQYDDEVGVGVGVLADEILLGG